MNEAKQILQTVLVGVQAVTFALDDFALFLDISAALDYLALRVLRVGGMPWWSTTLSARDGSATYSPYVTLEAR